MRTFERMPYLDMRQSLTIQNQTFTLLHGIIDVEVLHTEDILVDVQLAKIPARIHEHAKSRANQQRSAYQIMVPRASIALFESDMSLIGFGTLSGRTDSSSSSMVSSPRGNRFFNSFIVSSALKPSTSRKPVHRHAAGSTAFKSRVVATDSWP